MSKQATNNKPNIVKIQTARSDTKKTIRSSAKTVRGTSDSDLIIGTSNNQTLLGRQGNDVLTGRGANPTIKGGPGNDVLVGRGGNAHLRGGAGADIFRFTKANNEIGGGIETTVVEQLKLKVPAEWRDAWITAEQASWEPWLQQQPGYLGRDLLWDAESEEGTALIRWSSREQWKAITPDQVETVQNRFEELARQGTGSRQGNPFPLVFEGELQPLQILQPTGVDTITDFNPTEGDRLNLHSATETNASRKEWIYIGSNSFSEQAGELRFSNGLLQADLTGDGTANLQIRLEGLNAFSTSWII
jgi:uncharacterized protein (TIGR03792 family)